MRARIARITIAAIGTTALTALTMLGAGGAAYASTAHASTNSPQKMARDALFPKSNFRSLVGPTSTAGSVQPRVTGSNGQINGYSAVWITPHNGRGGTFNQGFHSSYVQGCNFWTCWRNVNSGSSYTHWLGSSPYNASEMGLTDNIWVGGVAISISVGSGGGFGITVGNNTVTLSSSYGNTWQIAHSYYNVDFSTHLAIWGPYQNSSASASFTWQTFYNNIN